MRDENGKWRDEPSLAEGQANALEAYNNQNLTQAIKPRLPATVRPRPRHWQHAHLHGAVHKRAPGRRALPCPESSDPTGALLAALAVPEAVMGMGNNTDPSARPIMPNVQKVRSEVSTLSKEENLTGFLLVISSGILSNIEFHLSLPISPKNLENSLGCSFVSEYRLHI